MNFLILLKPQAKIRKVAEIVERSQILASSPILLTSGATYPPGQGQIFDSNLSTESLRADLKVRLRKTDHNLCKSEEELQGEDGRLGKESLSVEVL